MAQRSTFTNANPIDRTPSEPIVVDIDTLPTAFVDRVMATGRRIADELHIAPAE